MVFNCRRCRREKWHGELREGSRTGANAIGYKTLTSEINASGILKVENRGNLRNVLCPRCLKELDRWIKAEGGPHRLAPLASVEVKEKAC